MKQIITLAMSGGEPPTLQVEADVLDGLAVHRWQGIHNADWQLTHIKSGMGLGAPFRLKRFAAEARERLLAMGDWDIEQAELEKWLAGPSRSGGIVGTRYEQASGIIKAKHDEEANR